MLSSFKAMVPGAVVVLDALHSAGQALAEVPLASQEGLVEALTPTFAWRSCFAAVEANQSVYIISIDLIFNITRRL